ncbi:predicted protein [Streptomyces albidoflavus]|nr:predicted protein [Streptomyces albidoflavus]
MLPRGPPVRGRDPAAQLRHRGDQGHSEQLTAVGSVSPESMPARKIGLGRLAIRPAERDRVSVPAST